MSRSREEAALLARSHLTRVPDLLRRLSRHNAPTTAGPLIEEVVRLLVDLERDAHVLHGYGEALDPLARQVLWASERLAELVREAVQVRVPHETAMRLEDHAIFFERWLADEGGAEERQ